MTRRWQSSILLLVIGLVWAAWLAMEGSPGWAAAILAVFALAAVLTSPRAFPHSVPDAEARAAQATDGRPIIYWRPGCPFCVRLRAALARDASHYHWVDIWADPDGAASVRAVTGGDETVPTVIAADESYVNPTPHLVRRLAVR